MQDHASRVLRVAIAVQHAGGGKLRLRKDTSNLFRDRASGAKRGLDVRDFNHVLGVDAAPGIVEAEGMVTYEDLVAATLAKGFLPAVVPELKTITLGGAAAGVGVEASSFKFGLVHETLDELEILTGDGRVLVCRPDNEHADLFFGFPNSYGTLGYTLKLAARAIAAKPFVEITHRRYTRSDEFFAALDAACAAPNDFVDGVVFGPDELYVNVGRFTDTAPYTSDYTYERIYYRSLKECELDYLTTHDFIWRWDTDWFWCSKNVGAQNPLLRRLFGRRRLGSRTYQRLMRWNTRWGVMQAWNRLRGGGAYTESVIQDVDIPLEHADAFLRFFEREIRITPIWICPIRAGARADRFTLYPLRPGQLYMNFGFWDVARRPERYGAGHLNRLVEAEVIRLSGIKSLYSDSYYTPDVFWKLYGGEAYHALKAKYDPAGTFPDLYQKCVLRH
ncbi:MAG: FAD-binding oxidoreductase [Betaproteobacteria bacterium]|nr:MAG: FAD-binding oxidoreductase [Betaproteobacteria bacterium]